MGELRSHGTVLLIFFPIDAHSFVVVSELHLNFRFSLQANTIWVEREIFDLDTRLLVHIFHETSKVFDNGNVVWEFGKGKYRICGWPNSQMGVSIELYVLL